MSQFYRGNWPGDVLGLVGVFCFVLSVVRVVFRVGDYIFNFLKGLNNFLAFAISFI